jgi:hypothetical protein
MPLKSLPCKVVNELTTGLSGQTRGRLRLRLGEAAKLRSNCVEHFGR